MTVNLECRAKVYITQIPNRKDQTTGVWCPTVNVAPAGVWGEIVVMMPSQANYHATSDCVSALRTALRDYDYERGDCLVALGDPCIIAIACGILGRDFGKWILLKWDRNTSQYTASHIRI